MNTLEQWAALLAILMPVALAFVLWQAVVEAPKRRYREARSQQWLKRQQEYEAGLCYGDDHQGMRRMWLPDLPAVESVCVAAERVGPDLTLIARQAQPRLPEVGSLRTGGSE